jgi:glycosyltransferase involved in cell wall biosynthesis
VPLVVSIWGNDLTLHAQRTSQMRSHTIRTLQRANGLLADAQRDLRLAVQWGYDPEKPALVVPGAGGIDLAEITRLSSGQDTTSAPVPGGVPLVLNPRGFRPGSVRNDIFFEAIPLVLKERPEVFFACAAMAGQREALQYIEQYGLQEHVRLLPYLPQAQLWSLFQRAEVSVSVSAHDGTPNSLLEAMACRCFPIVGDIESLREWITPGVNGLLVEPDNAPALAEAILRALAHPELREKAAGANRRILEERAEVGVVREKIAAFYQQMLPVLEE